MCKDLTMYACTAVDDKVVRHFSDAKREPTVYDEGTCFRKIPGRRVLSSAYELHRTNSELLRPHDRILIRARFFSFFLLFFPSEENAQTA